MAKGMGWGISSVITIAAGRRWVEPLENRLTRPSTAATSGKPDMGRAEKPKALSACPEPSIAPVTRKYSMGCKALEGARR